MTQPKFLLTGDTSLSVEFGNEINEELNARVHALFHLLEKSRIPGVVEAIPTYRSLMVHYDPEVIRYDALVTRLRKLVDKAAAVKAPPGMVLEIPVLYGGEAGPDLEYVAQHHNTTPEEIIRIHCSTEYLIYMLGFTPGFTYLGGMDPALNTPRLQTPRVKIPAGSVGIAGSQTGIYPIDSPGGWQLIGRTPVKIYSSSRSKPILPEAGMYIKFYPITKEEYDEIEIAEAAGSYVCRKHPRGEGSV